MLEVYDKTKHVKGEEAVSISSLGRIGISKKLVEKHDIRKYTHAELYYDETERSVGVLFLGHKTKNSYKVTFTKAGTTITGSKLCRNRKLQTPQKSLPVEVKTRKDSLWMTFSPKEIQP